MTHLRQQQSFASYETSLLQEISRRRFLRQSAGLAAGIALLASPGLTAYAAEEKTLLAVNSADARPQRVRVAVEVAGQMKMNPTGKELKYLPMSVTADLNFL